MSKKKLLDAARASFIKIMDVVQNMRKGKKDRRATPPVGGDGRVHDRRKNPKNKPDKIDPRVESREAFLQEQEVKKFADSRVEMEKLWGKHLKKGKNINN